MKEVNQKIIDEWNINADSDWYMIERTDEIISGIINNPETAFHCTTWAVIKSVFSNLVGKKICVPSSGDNKAVFAFAALGAHVTSCDICERQLEHAAKIAKKFNLDIEFIVQNTMELTDIKSDTYDFVYTSEGVHVWIDDLASMYKNINRVLKPGGVYINYEIHPFCRPFDYADGKPKDKDIIVQKPYEFTGPFDEGVTYAWRVQDFLNAIADSGLKLRHFEEMHDEKDKGHFWFYRDKREAMTQEEINTYYDWKINPLAALPQWFTVLATK